MIDPTFSTQFGLAAQRDILRQAAEDWRRRQAWWPGREFAGLVATARHLAGTFGQAARRGGREPVRTGATELCQPRTD